MVMHSHERTFKNIGQTLEHAFLHLGEGMTLVETLDQATDEREREMLTSLATLKLHHAWHALVKVFRRVGHNVDEGVPKGTNSADLLIDQMLQRTDRRPQILSTDHLDMARKLTKFYKDFRNARADQHSRRDVVDFIEFLNDEITPGILENVRVMALLSPGGAKLVAHLQPKSVQSGVVQQEELKRA